MPKKRPVVVDFEESIYDRLTNLHQRSSLAGAGVVTASGNLIEGSRVEVPMSDEVARRIAKQIASRNG